MKKRLPEPSTQGGALFKLPYEVVKWELLKTAMKLKVFDLLSKPTTSSTIAETLSLNPSNTEVMLNGLTAIGCLKKKDGLFCNTSVASQHLHSDQDTYLGDSLLFMEGWILPLLQGGLETLIREGAPTVEHPGNEDRWAVGARMSVNHSRCGRVQRLASIVKDLPEAAFFRNILDLGGGSGILSVALAEKLPKASIVLNDQPAVLKVAEDVLAEYGMEDRISFLPGDYSSLDLGHGYDLILASYTLNFYKHRLDELMEKFLNALNPGGVLLVATDGLTDEKTGPEAMIISWISTALMGMDMSFDHGEMAQAMLRAGFQSTQTETVTDIEVEAHGPVDIVIGRKAG